MGVRSVLFAARAFRLLGTFVSTLPSPLVKPDSSDRRLEIDLDRRVDGVSCSSQVCLHRVMYRHPCMARERYLHAFACVTYLDSSSIEYCGDNGFTRCEGDPNVARSVVELAICLHGFVFYSGLVLEDARMILSASLACSVLVHPGAGC